MPTNFPATVATPDLSSGVAWSYSALKNFETCPRRYENYNVTKTIVEPQTEEMKEGWRVHKAFEDRLLFNKPFPMGMGMYEKIGGRIANRSTGGDLYGEQKLAFTATFEPSSYFGKGVWFRTVVDVGIQWTDHATIFDWKTGKVSPDVTQLQMMASAIFIHAPQIELVKAALVFINHDHFEVEEYTRDDLTEIWGGILPRYRTMQAARVSGVYPAKPSGLCKRYCAVTTCEFHGKGRR